MNFAKALLQRIGLLSGAESETVDPVYALRLDRLCANEQKRHGRGVSFKPAPSHPEV